MMPEEERQVMLGQRSGIFFSLHGPVPLDQLIHR